MSKEYESAKRIALGIEKEVKEKNGDDIWNISFDGGVGIGGFMAEMPFQFFERGFDPPEEQTMHKTALMLFDEEYMQDKQVAEDNLRELIAALKASDADGIRKLTTTAPVAQWLSLIFIDGNVLREELVPAVKGASQECRSAFADAVDCALTDLLVFKDLMEALRSCC